MPQWSLLSITCTDRPVKDVLGNVLEAQPIQPGMVLTHWADPDLAMGWFQYAQTRLSDPSLKAALNAAPSFGSVTANQGLVQKQLQFCVDVLTAIANGYNALNLPWYNDPEARRIYRKYFSGLPDTTGGQTVPRVFGPFDYRTNWYTASTDTPNIGYGIDANGPTSAGSHPYGTITQNIINGFRTYYPRQSRINAHPIDIVLSSMLVLTTPPGLPAPRGVAISNDVQNAAMVRQRNQWTAVTPRPADEPFATRYPDFPQMAAVYPGPNPVNLLTAISPPLDDWRAVYFNMAQEVAGIEATSENLGAAVGLSNYVAWFQEMVDAVLARAPSDVIQDARAFVVYENQSTWAANGGLNNTIALALHADADIYNQQTRYQGVFQAVGSGALAIGGGLAPATYGISALIGGAIAMTSYIMGAEFRASFSGYGRDDLGRLKPVFDRGWLSGDPANPDPNAAAPALVIEDPPGWARPLPRVVGRSYSASDLLPISTIGGNNQAINPAINQGSNAQDNTVMIAGLAIAAGVGYLVLKNSKQRKS